MGNTIKTTKYIRKPLYVDAVRINANNFDAVVAWCQGEVDTDQTSNKQFIKVRVHNPKNPRQTKAFVGDWLLYTERGYKVYTNKAFHASFDKAKVATQEELETVFGKTGAKQKERAERLQRGGEVATDGAAITQVQVEPGLRTETPQEVDFSSTNDESWMEDDAKSDVDRQIIEGEQERIGKEITGEPNPNITEGRVIEDVHPHSVGPVAAEPGNGVGEIVSEEAVMTPDQVRAAEGISPVDPAPGLPIRHVPIGAMAQAIETIESEGGTVEEATPEGIADAVEQNERAIAEEESRQAGIQQEATATDEPVAANPDELEQLDQSVPIYIDPATGGYTNEAPHEGAIPVNQDKLAPVSAPVEGVPDNVEAQPEQESVVPAAVEGKRVLSIEEQREMTAEQLKDLIMAGEVVLAQDIAQA